MSLFKTEYNPVISSNIQNTLNITNSGIAGQVMTISADGSIIFTNIINTIIPLTHSELYNLYITSGLIPGQKYQLTDFKTKYNQPITNAVKEATNFETLVLFATSINTFSNKVYSIEFTKDYIEYDITNILCEDNITARVGKIIHRIDDKNNETYYDHRTVLFDRNGTDYLTFGINSMGNSIGYTTPEQTDSYPNIVLEDECLSNKFGDECNLITLEGGCNYNIFGNSCYDIKLRTNTSSNKFGMSCQYIDILQMSNYNTFGNFVSHIFANVFNNTIIEDTISFIGVDFSLATLISTTYTKNIIIDSLGVPKITYIDGTTGLLVVTSVNY